MLPLLFFQGCWSDIKKNESKSNFQHDSSYHSFFKRYPFLKGADSILVTDSILSKYYYHVKGFQLFSPDSVCFDYYTTYSEDGMEVPVIRVITTKSKHIVPVRFELNFNLCNELKDTHVANRYYRAFEFEFNRIVDTLITMENGVTNDSGVYWKKFVATPLANVFFPVMLGYRMMSESDTLQIHSKLRDRIKLSEHIPSDSKMPANESISYNYFMQDFRNNYSEIIFFDEYVDNRNLVFQLPNKKYLYYINRDYQVIRISLDNYITVKVYNPTCNSSLYF